MDGADIISRVMIVIELKKWAVQVLVLVLATLLLSLAVRYLLRRLEAKLESTRTVWDNAVVGALRCPMTVLIWIVGVAFAVQIVQSKTDAAILSMVHPLRDVGIIATIAWFLIRFIHNAESALRGGREAQGLAFDRAEYNMFDYMPHWIEPLVGSAEERAAKLRNPAAREAMKDDVVARPHARTNWDTMTVVTVQHERNQQFEGMSLTELAQKQDKHPLDAWLDLALDEDLQTLFSHNLSERGDDILGSRIMSPYSHISLSDGGAHIRYLTISTWPVHFLSYWVREKQLTTLEHAHYKMSAYPAWLSDYKGRGTLRIGDYADIMIYNLDELGFVHNKPTYAHDFPGNEWRRVEKPTGMRYILVNGEVTFQDNECTGALPGKLLRSYDMVD